MTSTTLKDAANDAAESYDALPYVSLPFVQMQPARIAALARLFGLHPPAIDKARVLEIGCAAGGHLIPLAFQFPHARFLGIDPSSRQIADGQRRASEFQLSNLELRPVGIEGLKPADGPFDYILCHGVYSWVPDPVREAILKTISELLSPNGIAYVSYNVLPGWTMRQAVRESLLIMTDGSKELKDQVSHARKMIGFLERSTDEDMIWGKIWRHEAEQLEYARDDYIGHEFLEPENAPCAFVDFIGEAHRFNLTYLCESELFTMIPENLGNDVAQELRKNANNQLYAVEQMLDIVMGRTFRQTLLVHHPLQNKIERNIMPDSMAPFHLIFNGPIHRKRGSTKRSVMWQLDNGCSYESQNSTVIKAVDYMVSKAPYSVSYQELLDYLQPDETQGLLAELLRLLTYGLVDISVQPVHGSIVVNTRPHVFEIARIDAKNKLSSTANLLHDIADLKQYEWQVLPHCDGTRTVDELYDLVFAELGEKATMKKARQIVDTCLKHAAENALLHRD